MSSAAPTAHAEAGACRSNGKPTAGRRPSSGTSIDSGIYRNFVIGDRQLLCETTKPSRHETLLAARSVRYIRTMHHVWKKTTFSRSCSSPAPSSSSRRCSPGRAFRPRSVGGPRHAGASVSRVEPERQRERGREGGRETETERQTKTARDSQRQPETDRDRQRQTETDRDRQRQRQTETDRDTDRHRHKERHIQRG